MLWPGSLIVASDRYPNGGVLIYALMAAGGDLGASVGPQLVGLITDFAILNPTVITMAQTLGATPEQLGMKLGMLIGMLFPLFAIPVYAHFWRGDKKKRDAEIETKIV
jgi:MFS family permease